MDAETLLLRAHRPEDEGNDVWHVVNRRQGSLVRCGVSHLRHDARGWLRSIRALHGIDSKVTLSKPLWGLAERVTHGETLPAMDSVTFSA